MRVFISAGLFYPSKLGGPANTLYWLAKGFISKGVKVSVVTSNNFIDSGLVDFDKWATIDKIRIRYCTSKSKLNFHIFWYSIKELRNCDVVLLSSIFYIPSFFIALFSIFTKKKIIWSPRGELFDSAINGLRTKLLFIRILKVMFAKRVIFHATSSEEKKQIEKYLGSNVDTFITPNYIELPVKQDRKELSDSYFLYVGRIAPIKALDNLLWGLAKSDTFISSDYKLLIAGGIEKQFEGYNEQLRQILDDNKQLKNKVVFLGNVVGEEKFKLYANAYFSILISHSENFGNVVIEALSQGTPVIASKGTPWKQLIDNESGFWINNDFDSIAECIDKAINIKNEEYLQYRNNASDLAKEFDVYENIDKWIEVLKK